MAAHTSLAGLSLKFARLHTPAALDAVVDAALARRLQSVTLDVGRLSRASAPALARLLGGDALTTLDCRYMELLNKRAVAVLAAALRANATLTSLALNHCGVVWRDPAAVAVLLGALTGHASVRTLCLQYNSMRAADQAAMGAALGALVAANAPALTQLDVLSVYDLDNVGLRPLFEALPRSTHLRTLSCQGKHMRAAFARDVLLPALRANTSLRRMDTTGLFRSAALSVARELRSRAQHEQ
jgi:hypothetical protein